MNSVNRRLLKLLSLVLELPGDYLWGKWSAVWRIYKKHLTIDFSFFTENVQSHDGLVGDGYFRHALYYPLEAKHKKERKGIRMYGYVPIFNHTVRDTQLKGGIAIQITAQPLFYSPSLSQRSRSGVQITNGDTWSINQAPWLLTSARHLKVGKPINKYIRPPH